MFFPVYFVTIKSLNDRVITSGLHVAYRKEFKNTDTVQMYKGIKTTKIFTTSKFDKCDKKLKHHFDFVSTVALRY